MRTIVIIILIFSISATHAQRNATPYIEKAKQWSEVKLYDLALKSVSEGLEKFPKHHDLKTYEIRVFLWQEDFEKADSSIDDLLLAYPDDYEGLQLQATSYWWSNRWKQLKKVSHHALMIYPGDPFFTEKSLIALMKLKEYEKVNKLISKTDTTTESIEELALNSKLQFHQRVGIGVNHSQFDNTFSPWTITEVFYYKEAKHSFNLGIYHGNMFGKNGTLIDAAFYPAFRRQFRGIIEAGGSYSHIFPRYKVGLELVKDIHKMELGLGSRLMTFRATENQVLIHSARVGLNVGNMYINYKGYLAQLDNRSSDFTHTILVRRNLDNRFHFLQLNLSRGATPLRLNTFSEISRLEVNSIHLSYHVVLLEKWMINTSLGIQNEEYLTGERRRFDSSMKISYIF